VQYILQLVAAFCIKNHPANYGKNEAKKDVNLGGGLSCLSEVYSKSLSLRTAVCRTARTVV
jgi:hypothetical protein